MAKFFVATVAAVEAATLAVTYSDCGDASTHAKVTDLQPTTIETGSTTTLVGTGNLDETVTGATFTMDIKANGVQLKTCSGDASSDVECDLPLNVGSLTLKALTFPINAGSTSISVDTKLSALIPASLAKTTSHITAVADNGDKMVCLDVNTAKQSLETAGVDCSTSACPSACACANDKCADVVDACLADSACAQGQTCALACACGDTACTLKCAAANPSSKALPVATCVNSKCASLETAAVDCSTSACPSECACANDKCADVIDACLADSTCAQGQSCALACACGDTACSLKCAAANPSSKALPVATCVNSKCASLEAAAVDCSGSACPSACACANDKCGDVIDACLADSACAAGQTCAFACACGDTACTLKCAAANPSSKALPVATCINSKCPSTEVVV